MKKSLLTVFTLLFLASFSHLRASHVMGADLTFACQGPNKYLVTLQVYRDCNGTTVDGPLTVKYKSAQCGVSSSISLHQVGSAVDITPICLQSTDACHGGNGYGFQKYTFQGVLNLPAGCGSDWVLSWTLCCRNAAITTLNNPANDNLYIAANLNNTLATCDNSPTFGNDPVGVYCQNFPQSYNHGAVDADGDSLYFYLLPAYDAANTPEVYNSPYSATNPLSTTSGTTIDPQTGQLTFTPNQTQIGVVNVGVDEFRNGIKIGHVERDVQIIVANCTNSSPTALGINGQTGTTANIYHTSACSNFCFTIQTADANVADSVYYTWINSNLPGATISSSGGLKPLLTICWAPTQSDVGTHNFVLALRNNDCPYYGTASIAYTVIVAPSSDPPVDAGPDVTLCPGQSTTLTATSTGTVTSYTWSDGTNTHSGATWLVNPAITTIYTVSAAYANGCVLTDQVIVNRNPQPTVTAFPPLATICSTADTVQITGIATNATSFQWFPAAGLTCTTCASPKASPTATTTYSVVVKDAAGCVSDTFRVTINLNAPPPTQSCSVIYATVNGNGPGSQGNPTNLPGALAKAQCNNALIKLAIGNYTVDYPITNIGSNTTIEGGFDSANNWIKTSLPGATTIFRSNLNLEGTGNTKRLVGIYLNGAQYVRFQDLTIQTANCPARTGADTFGYSNYVFHLTSCSNYDFVRCQIIPGSGSGGANGASNPGTGVTGSNGNAASGKTAGPAPTCANAGGAGGNGGGTGTITGGSGGGGSTGVGNTGGAGTGGGGGGGSATCPSVGLFSSGDGANGNPGSVGATGGVGATGANGIIAGGFFNAGSIGGNGLTGGTGGGGGGGGGSGGTGGSFLGLADNGGGGGSGGCGGGGGPGGFGGYGGGGSFGIFINGNGAGGVILQCNVAAPAAGAGGTGGGGGNGGGGGTGGASGSGNKICNNSGFGAGGTGGTGGTGGNGGSGAAGAAVRVYLANGTALVTADTTFNLVAQPTIKAANISCTLRNDTLSAAASGAWVGGAGANPAIGSGVQFIDQYTTTGRKDIGYNSNNYSGFIYIALDQSSFVPVIQSSASVLNTDTFYVCQGSTANFNIQIASADTFDWNFGGATSPNTYVGANFQNLTNLSFDTAGVFPITVRIKTSCCGWSNYVTSYLLVEPQAKLSFTGLPAFCPGDSAIITLHGGTVYSWAPVAGVSNTNDSVYYLSPQVTTTYLVTSNSPRGVCNADTSITITKNLTPTLTFNTTPATCGSIGSITAVPSPAGSYTYTWVPDSGSTATLNNQPAGTYQVTVTSTTSSCSVTGAGSIGTAGGLQAYILSSVSPLCFGDSTGQLKVEAIGGQGPYSYAWSNGVTGVDSIIGLKAITYTVTITDANTCTSQASQQLTQPNQLFAVVLDSTANACATQCKGTALADGLGGIGPYTFVWSDPNAQDSNHAVNLCSGAYTVTVKDINHCSAVSSVNIGALPALTVDTISTSNVTCYGLSNGSITLGVSGGIYPYTYVWPQILTITDSLSVNLPADTFTPVVIDAVGCRDTLPVVITQPGAIKPYLALLDSISCFGANNGKVVIGVNGGVSPFTYALDGSGSYQASDTFSGLLPGPHTVTVLDAHSCDSVFPFSIYEPTILNATTGYVRNATCSGTCNGSVLLNITGGTPTFTLSKDGGLTSVTTDSLTGLCAGPYSLLVTDAKHCTYALPDTITEPLALGVSLGGSTAASCYNSADGQIVVAVSGGTQAYAYSLDNGATQASDSFKTATEGSHQVIVTDANGCADSITVVVGGPSPIIATPTLTQNVCFDSSTGKIVLAVTGGNGPFTYSWPQIAGNATDSATALAADTFNTYVTDTRGCVDTVTNIITQPAQPVLAVLPFDTTISYGDTIQLVSQFGPASLGTPNGYVWTESTQTLSCLSCPSPTTGSTDSVNLYTLVVTYNNNLCAVSITDSVNVLQVDTFALPSAFSPNNDNVNDTYFIPVKDATSFHMSIYNRWGETVFNTNDPKQGWDGNYGGKAQPEGVYSVFLNMQYGKGKQMTRTISITLLR